MPQVWAQNGNLDALDQLLLRFDTNWSFGLFQNNFNPSMNDDFDFADLVECSFTGYARIPSSTWPAATATIDGLAQSVHTTLTWTFGGGGAVDVYGVFVIVDGGGHVMYLERHPSAPVNLSVVGDPFAYTPKMLGSGFVP